MQSGEELRKALEVALIGRHKLVGAAAFPEKEIEGAEVEVSRILSGERRPTFSLLEATLLHGNPEPLLRYVERTCAVRFTRIEEREELLREIHDLTEQLPLLLERLDRVEGRGPVKVPAPSAQRSRERA